MQYSLRKASDADRALAELLHELCYKDVVIRQFGEWDSALQRQFFERKWQPEQYTVIVCEGESIGVLAAHHEADHLFLSEILIHPSQQNQGIGSAILTELLDRARTQRVPLRLQVLQSNRASVLYERLGFICYGRSDTHLLFEKS